MSHAERAGPVTGIDTQLTAVLEAKKVNTAILTRLKKVQRDASEKVIALRAYSRQAPEDPHRVRSLCRVCHNPCRHW